jgi:ubiquinone/menaquinone biosynthesis C-methylase UbiE
LIHVWRVGTFILDQVYQATNPSAHENDMTTKTGTEQVKRYYDEKGWEDRDGVPFNLRLFGTKEDGPIRIELRRLHLDRVRSALSLAGTSLNLLECGCGGAPGRELLNLCARYTGVDFSYRGLEKARFAFADVQIPHEFKVADLCALPFYDGAFDAVYCAHTIYHIVDPSAQETALAEMVRVVRPGGVVVLVAANPRPLAFPIRLARRLLADMPVIGSILNRLRPAPEIPYAPKPIGWMRRRLSRRGPVEVITHDLPSVKFNQKITEFRGIGKFLWRFIRWLDINHPKLSAYLGNYVILICKRAHSPELECRTKATTSES